MRLCKPIQSFAIVLLASCTLLLLSCGGSSSSSTTTTVPPPTAASAYMYGFHPVQQNAPSFVTVWGVNTQSGALTLQPGSPMQLPYQSVTPASQVDPKNRFLFITAGFCDEPRIYRLDATGKLPSLSSPDLSVPCAFNLRFHPSGNFFYTTELKCIGCVDPNGPIDTWQLSTTASPSRVGGSVGPGIFHITMDPAGKFLYAFDESSELLIYPIDQSTGSLGTPTVMPTDVDSLVFHPSGKFVYALTDEVTFIPFEKLDLYSVDASTGALTFVSTQQTFNNGLILNPSGLFAYTCNGAGQVTPCTLQLNSVDPQTGTLTPRGPLGVDIQNCADIEISRDGRFLYCAGRNGAAGKLLVYQVDLASGAVTARSDLTVASDDQLLRLTY